MRIISPKALKQFAIRQPAAGKPLAAWTIATSRALWRNMMDVRELFPHADAVLTNSGRTVVIFNVGGNKFRLITAIHFNTGRVYILRVFTHGEYDRIDWKEQL